MNLPDRYQESLRSIPPSGCGCHPYLLAVSNYGIMSGLDAEQIFSDIRSAIPQGTRRISDREITDAINKAMQDHNGGTFTPKARPAPVVRRGFAPPDGSGRSPACADPARRRGRLTQARLTFPVL